MRDFKIISCLIVVMLLLHSSIAYSQARTTSFRETGGFYFSNSFKVIIDDDVTGIDIRSFDGLCGGMSYAALDYFNAGIPIPKQWYRPAEGSVLQKYIYGRLVDSIASNVDKWAELLFNPFGWRNSEFFNWGLEDYNGGRIEELRSFVDYGKAVNLGLFGIDGTAHHQVTAIGYDMGRYKGDLGSYKEDFKIFVLDPNYPRQRKVLVPDVSGEYYTYADNPGGKKYRTYFVDKNYHPKKPPVMPNMSYPDDGLIYELVLEMRTGDDDMRGGNDNLHVTPVMLGDGSAMRFFNVNLGARWISNYTQFVPLKLDYPVRPEDLRSITLNDTFGGGIAGDNWDMEYLQIHAVAGEKSALGYRYWSMLNPRAGFRRFTGQHDPHTIMIDAANLEGAAEEQDRLGEAVASGDFNGDGNDDLAIGVPYENDGNTVSSGAVNVIHGSHSGLTGRANFVYTAKTFGGTAVANDYFGYSLASGDFNNDGYDDLAIGVPYKEIGSVTNAGAVYVMPGGPLGLTTSGSSMWHQNVSGVKSVARDGDLFGFSLSAGDFDNDGHDDLAVGVYGQDIGSFTNAGAVQIFYGSGSGLLTNRNHVIHQDTSGVPGDAEVGDGFGWTLASGDLNGDGYADLAVGVVNEDVGTLNSAGSVNVIYGSNTGLTGNGAQLWHQDSGTIEGAAEPYDNFGYSLAIGRFNYDGYDDLAIGVPGEDIGTISNAGAVNVIYGSSQGLRDNGNQIWYQGYNGIAGAAETGDFFGRSLVAGNFNGDAFSDLAIGVEREDVGDIRDAGSVNVIYGDMFGLKSDGNQLWHQDSKGILDSAELSDYFGSSLASGDFDNDRLDDLAIGVPCEDLETMVNIGGQNIPISTVVNAGALNVIYGNNRTEGLSDVGDQVFHQ